MRKATFISSFLLVVLITSNVNSQDLFYPGIMHALNSEQDAQLDDAVKLLKKASGNENNANAIDRKYARFEKKSNKKDWNKKTWEAKQQRILAEMNYQKAYRMIFDLYSEILTNGTYATTYDKTEAISLNDDASKKFEEADTYLAPFVDNSKEQLEVADYEGIKNNLNEIHSLHVNGINNQISALKIYIDSSVKTVKNEEDDIVLEDAQNEESYTRTNSRNVDVRENINQGLVFKVQIAASKVDLSEWVISAKAPNAEEIETLYIDNWNKYMVGEFNSYQEAARYRDLLRSTSPDAFIVVFKSGNQIQVTNAMKNSSENL
ncbi:MAG: hypothetical protein DRI95_13455 [Bacteroidetes bacterium]|nr:MAG: hypothetical protein DRI95_13455 [Bacteroidota bacterium]RLD76549.1 MAG: hypothetical protein DRJ07_16165 [Bacteroidota bacterium]